MQEQVAAVAIDDAPPPPWVRRYHSPKQAELDRGLLWVLLVFTRRGWDASRTTVAQRLYIHTVGRERKQANPGMAGIAADLDLSETTVAAAIEDLEAGGWLIVERGRHNRYRLAWPPTDRHPDTDGPRTPRCGAPTKKGGRCTRRAGRGTPTPDLGPCVLHGGTPHTAAVAAAPDTLDTTGERTAAPGQAPEPAPPEPQPLGLSHPVDNPDAEPVSTPAAGALNPNHWGAQPQPLEQTPPAAGVEYVGSALRSTSGVKALGVLPVGQLQVDNARATPKAPSAQPATSSSAARFVIAAIPRYRAAEPWVRVRLAVLADAALAAGFGHAAIVRYAQMAIDSARFGELQHIPELRDALRCLARDAALQTACRTCGRDPDGSLCCVAPGQADRPWTADDQAALERVLDRLGAPDDLAATGTESP